MKAIKTLSILFLAIFFLASCSKDEDLNPNPDPHNSPNFAKEMAGEFVGLYTGKAISMDEAFEVTVIRIDNKHVKISGADFGSFEATLTETPTKEWIINNISNTNPLTMYYVRATGELFFSLEYDNGNSEYIFSGNRK